MKVNDWRARVQNIAQTVCIDDVKSQNAFAQAYTLCPLFVPVTYFESPLRLTKKDSQSNLPALNASLHRLLHPLGRINQSELKKALGFAFAATALGFLGLNKHYQYGLQNTHTHCRVAC